MDQKVQLFIWLLIMDGVKSLPNVGYCSKISPTFDNI